MTTTERPTSHVSLITKIKVPSSFSTRTTDKKQIAKSPKPVLSKAGISGVNGKFSRVYGKKINDAPYFRNDAGFEISLMKGGQYWAILGPDGKSIFYYAQAELQIITPPTEWQPHTLAKQKVGSWDQPALTMQIEEEAGDVTQLTPRNVKESSLTPRGEGERSTQDILYPATTPFDGEGTPVMCMSFMQTPVFAGADTSPSFPSITPGGHIRDRSISESRSLTVGTRDSRRTSCYEDNDAIDSPQPAQTIPVTQPHTLYTPTPMQARPIEWTRAQQGPFQLPKQAVHLAHPSAGMGIPVAPPGQIYLPPSPMQMPASPLLMTAQAPTTVYHTNILPVNQAGLQSFTLNPSAMAHAVAYSPGLQQLAQAVYNNMTGICVDPNTGIAQQPQQINWSLNGFETQPQPVTQPEAAARSSFSSSEGRRSSRGPPPGLPFPARLNEQPAAASVSDLGGEQLTMERPRTASAGVIAPPSSSEGPATLPRFYRVVVEAGITYRMTNDMEDKFTGQVAAKGEVVDVEDHDGSFVRCRNGLWLPKHYGDVTLLEPCDKDVHAYNVLLEPGISYRKSMDMADKSKRAFAQTGEEVMVYRVEGNWAFIPGGHYLPVAVATPDGSKTYQALELKQPTMQHGIHITPPQPMHNHQDFDMASSSSNSQSGGHCSIEILSNHSGSAHVEDVPPMPQPIARNESNFSVYSG